MDKLIFDEIFDLVFDHTKDGFNGDYADDTHIPHKEAKTYDELKEVLYFEFTEGKFNLHPIMIIAEIR